MSRLLSWDIFGDVAKLRYSDGSMLFIKKDVFNRAFGPIVSSSFETVSKDFAFLVVM